MDPLKLIPDILNAIAWPAALIVLVAILRKELKAAIPRLESAKLPGGAEFKLSKFGESKVDQIEQSAPAPQPDVSDLTKGQWKNVGNIYFLGTDLMWTVDAILRSAPKNKIVHGYRQSHHHLKEVGIENTSYGDQLSRLRQEAEKSLESDWTEAKREQAAIDTKNLMWEIGVFIQAQQKREDTSH
jgi:hypothetical protein